MISSKMEFSRSSLFSSESKQKNHFVILSPKPVKIRRNSQRTSLEFKDEENSYHLKYSEKKKSASASEKNNNTVSTISSISDENEYYFIFVLF